MENKNEKLKAIDNELYQCLYLPGKVNLKRASYLWEEVCRYPELLRIAIEEVFADTTHRKTVRGETICDLILKHPDQVPEDIYLALVDTVYGEQDIARTVKNGDCNGGESFLLMTLQNYELKLTSTQQSFALSEAMNKMGTTKTVKTGVFGMIGITQVHGVDPFDIRYEILRNPNFPEDKKQSFVYNFYANDEDWEKHLNDWGNMVASFIGMGVGEDPINFVDSILTMDSFDISSIIEDENVSTEIIDALEFVQRMHQYRPYTISRKKPIVKIKN